MEKKTYRWKEKKAVGIIIYTVMFLLVYCLVIQPVIVYPFINFIICKIDVLWMYYPCLYILPISLLLIMVCFIIETQTKYTNLFIAQIKSKLSEATTLSDLYDIQTEFDNEAIGDDGEFRLSYHNQLSKLRIDIESKINSLKCS